MLVISEWSRMNKWKFSRLNKIQPYKKRTLNILKQDDRMENLAYFPHAGNCSAVWKIYFTGPVWFLLDANETRKVTCSVLSLCLRPSDSYVYIVHGTTLCRHHRWWSDHDVVWKFHPSLSLSRGPSIPGPVFLECGCPRLLLAFSWFAPCTREYDHLWSTRPQGI